MDWIAANAATDPANAAMTPTATASVLVTLGTLHHHRRTGDTDRGRRRLVLGTVAAKLALTAVACTMVIARDV